MSIKSYNNLLPTRGKLKDKTERAGHDKPSGKTDVQDEAADSDAISQRPQGDQGFAFASDTFRKRIPSTPVMIVIAVAVFVFGFAAYAQNQKVKRDKASVQALVNLDNQAFSQLQFDEQTESAQGKYAQAGDAWMAYAQKTQDKNHQEKAWENAGVLYMSAAKFSQAVNSFQHAVKVNGLTYNLAQEIAQADTWAGDKADAITYYQKALSMMPSNIPDRSAQQQLFQQTIDQLKQEKS